MFPNNDRSKRKQPLANTIRWWLRDQIEDNLQLLLKVIRRKRAKGGGRGKNEITRAREKRSVFASQSQKSHQQGETVASTPVLFPLGSFFHEESDPKTGVGRGCGKRC